VRRRCVAPCTLASSPHPTFVSGVSGQQLRAVVASTLTRNLPCHRGGSHVHQPIVGPPSRSALRAAFDARIDGRSRLAGAVERRIRALPAAATRAALVAIITIGPGLADVPLTAVLYLGVRALFAIVDGALNLTEGVSLDREPGHRSGWLSLAATGTVAVVAGVFMFVGGPGVRTLRMLLVVLSIAHGASSAFGARRSPVSFVRRGAVS